jgi:hypothetical protein
MRFCYESPIIKMSHCFVPLKIKSIDGILCYFIALLISMHSSPLFKLKLKF